MADTIVTAEGGLSTPEDFDLPMRSIVAATLAIHLLSLAVPILTLQVYDRILPNQSSGTLLVLGIGASTALLLEIALRIGRSYITTWYGAVYEHRMSCKGIEHFLAADVGKLDEIGTGGAMHRFAAIGKLKDFYSGQGIISVIDAAFIAVFLAIIAYVGGILFFVTLSVLILFLTIIVFVGVRLRQDMRQSQEVDDFRYNFVIRVLSAIHTLKSFALEKSFERRYERLAARSSVANYETTHLSTLLINSSTTMSHLMIAVIIAVGSLQVIDQNLSVGALIASLLLSGRVMQSAQQTLLAWVRYQDFELARNQVVDLFSTPLRDVMDTESDEPRRGTLELKDVSFTLPGAQRALINGVSLNVEAGSTVAILGANGSGKTTLLKLMAGQYLPTSGSVLVDGVAPSTFYPTELPRRVGFLTTEGEIFRGRIRDNITRFGEESIDRAMEIAHLLKIDRDIARLPDGFDTFLDGTTAEKIPPGLRQRIALTRTLASKPRLLLFDNADRSLDEEGYQLIHSLLGRLHGKATIIIVSDDANLRSLADKTYQFENGCMTEPSERAVGDAVAAYRAVRL